MRRYFPTLFLGSVLMVASAPTAQSQQARDSTEYDERALRIESDYGEWNLVRGRDGVLVKKLSNWRSNVDLSAILAPSPEAVREGREFSRNYHRGWLKVGAGILTITAARLVDQMNDGPPALELSTTGVSVGGIILMIYGGKQVFDAHKALSRAIWWYNRDLTR